MALLANDPAAQAAVLEALAAVGAARTGYRPRPWNDLADPQLAAWAAELGDLDEPGGTANLPWHALATIAALALDEADAAGGDSAALLARLYGAVTRGSANRS